MDRAIRHHFNKNIKEQERLTGGYTFETWLLTLSDNQKVVFRTQRDFETGGGRKIVIADIFEREKFFYDTVNKEIDHICPKVYVIDGSFQYYENAYQISEYIEGTPLNTSCFNEFDTQTKDNIFYQIGQICAKIGKIEISENHHYIKQRGSWGKFITHRLHERLFALVKNDVITLVEIDKIIGNLSEMKAEKLLSLIHLDMRLENMVYNNGKIFLLDAENCEFGDHLFDLTVIDINYGLKDTFVNGYKSIANYFPDLNDNIYPYYKLERLALILYVYMNEVKSDIATTQHFLAKFNTAKSEILK